MAEWIDFVVECAPLMVGFVGLAGFRLDGHDDQHQQRFSGQWLAAVLFQALADGCFEVVEGVYGLAWLNGLACKICRI